MRPRWVRLEGPHLPEALGSGANRVEQDPAPDNPLQPLRPDVGKCLHVEAGRDCKPQRGETRIPNVFPLV